MSSPVWPATRVAADAASRRAGFGQTLRTVFFGLLGVAANRKDIADDTVRLSPLRILLIAVVFMVFFVAGLISLASRIATA